MNKLIIIIGVVIFLSSCELFVLDDNEKIADATEIMEIIIDRDTIDPVINRQVFIDIILDTNKVSGEQDIFFKTDYGSLSEIPYSVGSEQQKSLTTKTAGLKAKVLLKVDSSLNDDITFTATITSSENIEYKVVSKIVVAAFKPEYITLSVNMDSLSISLMQTGIITGELFSNRGKISDNLLVNFQTLSVDSAEAVLIPTEVNSTNSKFYTSIKSLNNKPGKVVVLCTYEEVVSDSLEVVFY